MKIKLELPGSVITTEVDVVPRVGEYIDSGGADWFQVDSVRHVLFPDKGHQTIWVRTVQATMHEAMQMRSEQ